jgi:D-alanyl-D-alanine carboxypeptidase/D-alanyl-D-alanine-endopeptidase (penicillin-binding protein 4)
LIPLFVLPVIALTFSLPRAAAAHQQTPRAKPKWVQRIDEIVGKQKVSVVIGLDGDFLYRHLGWVRRTPASNEKLLLSMALLDRLPTTRTIPTRVMAAAGPDKRGAIDGPVWVVGRGDPELDRAAVKTLANELIGSGVTKVRGRVLGSTSQFSRDWWASGWRWYFPRYYIALPTALTFRRNTGPGGRHVTDPERRVAAALIRQLEAKGVQVTGGAGAGASTGGLSTIAELRSDPLPELLSRMNVYSVNFTAEVLGKYLGARSSGAATISGGAAAIAAWAKRRGVDVDANDSSGLSYRNRISAEGMVRLLWLADAADWGSVLRLGLPRGGQGTLEDRLMTVRVRAKTGTLKNRSALSGWVWLEREGTWAEFSILSQQMSKARSVRIENAIVRVVAANAAA